MVPHFTGRIVDWDDARGHGWIETDGQRIFLHRREFAEFRKALDSLAHSLTLTGYVYVAPSPRPSFPATPLPVRSLDELTSRSFTLAGKGLFRGYLARGVQPQQRNRLRTADATTIRAISPAEGGVIQRLLPTRAQRL